MVSFIIVILLGILLMVPIAGPVVDHFAVSLYVVRLLGIPVGKVVQQQV
jgi:hypothetical protein